MAALDFTTLAQQCAPQVDPVTLAAVVRTESSFNPFAIGVVRGRLARQPRTLDEAVATVDALERGGWNYSVGLSQVNRIHFGRYGLLGATAFDPCRNLMAGADILSRCYGLASVGTKHPQVALRDGLSCYYSGNFQTGYRAGYVQRVVMNATRGNTGTAVPAIDTRTVMPLAPVKRDGPDRPGRNGTNGPKTVHVMPIPSVTLPASVPDDSNSAVVF